MSNIEPTDVTRTMRCPRCGATAAHTIRPALAGEAVACPTCAEKGRRVACVEVIEPTEEQRRAVGKLFYELDAHLHGHDIERVARLLAEREHRLNARIAELEERSARRLDDSTAIDALVYAVACLELQPGSERDRALRDAMARVINHVGAIEVRANDSATKLVSTLVAGAKAREAAHRAHIKALQTKNVALRERMSESSASKAWMRAWQYRAEAGALRARIKQLEAPTVVLTPLPEGTTIETTMTAAPMVRRMPGIPADDVRRILADAGLADVDVNVGGHDFEVRTTPMRGIDSGRARWAVRCKTCDVDVHTGTTGPAQMIRGHLLDAEGGEG